MKSSFDCSKPTKRGIDDYGVMETCELRQKFGSLPQKQPKLVVTEPITEKVPPKQVTFDPKKPLAQPKPAPGLNFNPKPPAGNALFTNAVQPTEPPKKTQPNLFPLPTQPPALSLLPPQTANQHPPANFVLQPETTIQPPPKPTQAIAHLFDLSKSHTEIDLTSPIKNITPIIKKTTPNPKPQTPNTDGGLKRS
jgi:hypothetical protein